MERRARLFSKLHKYLYLGLGSEHQDGYFFVCLFTEHIGYVEFYMSMIHF
jgi:hypothetical protein